MGYYRRIAILAAALLGLTIAALLLPGARDAAPATPASPAAGAAVPAAPRCADTGADTVAVIAQGPNGRDVSPASVITATFSCPVERDAVERAFVLYPPAAGAFTWEGRTLTFRPAAPLRPRTTYRVTLFGGLADARGFADGRKVSWPFVTGDAP
jgi:hypothetical protein